MKKQILVVAGGSGQRMNSGIPKQFLQLKGKAIILHTLERLSKVVSIPDIFLVISKEEESRWKNISKDTAFESLSYTFGGETRFDSVKAGLKLVDPKALVGIHDSVRPFVSPKTIESCFELAEKKGSGIPVAPLTDSIRRIFDGTSRAEPRDKYKIVQTPQCFQAKLIQEAYNRRRSKYYTDDASVFEAAGKKVYLVEGNSENIKLTNPMDLKIAEVLLSTD